MECTRYFVGVMGWVESNPAGSFYGTFFLCQGYRISLSRGEWGTNHVSYRSLFLHNPMGGIPKCEKTSHNLWLEHCGIDQHLCKCAVVTVIKRISIFLLKEAGNLQDLIY